jgi:Spy/CpxP family protein refolding chaperone
VGLALITVSGNTFAQADSGKVHAQAQEQEQQCCDFKHQHHHCDCCCNHKEQLHNWGHHERFAGFATKLNLSDQQKAQMEEVFKKDQPLVKPIFIKLINAKRELRTLIQSGSADKSAIRAQAAKVAGIKAGLSVQRAQMVKQLRAVLTPENVLSGLFTNWL